MPSERVCGECTACCKTHFVLSIDKPAGRWCKDCIIGKGCNIYVNRPSECADFKCQWLMGYADEQDRPDRLRIVIDFYLLPILNQKTASFWEVSEGALDRKPAQNLTKDMLQNNIPVLYVYLGANDMKLHLPSGILLTEEQRWLLTIDHIKIVSA